MFALVITGGMVLLTLLASYVVFGGKEEKLTPDLIADRVEANIESAVYVEDVTTVTQRSLEDPPAPLVAGNGPFTLYTRMAVGKVRNQTFDRGKYVKGFSSVSGRSQEYRASDGAFKSFETPFPQGTGDAMLSAPEDCVVGNHIYSWLGCPHEEGPDITRSIRAFIVDGEQLPDVEEQGRKCYLFLRTIPVYDGVIKHWSYIDKKTFVRIRWDTEQPGVIRTRISDTRFYNKEPEGVVWTLDPERTDLVTDGFWARK